MTAISGEGLTNYEGLNVYNEHQDTKSETEVKRCRVQAEGVVYIEKIFLLNLIMNLFLLGLTGRICGKSVSIKRRVIGGFFGALTYCLSLCLPELSYLWKVLAGMLPVGLFMVKLTLKTKGIRELLYGTGWLFTFSFLLGGFMLFLKGRFWNFGRSALWTTAVGLLGYEIIRRGVDVWKQKKKDCLRMVTLPADHGKIEVPALVDTGCGLIDPLSKKPVAILEEEVWEHMNGQKRPEKYRVIPFHSIGKEHGYLEGYEVEFLKVKGKFEECDHEKVIIAVFQGKMSKSGNYQMILPPELSV